MLPPKRTPPTPLTWPRIAALLIALLSVIAIVYRVPILTGFAYTTGHELDGIIATSLIEHWWNVFRGEAHWATVNYFAPHSQTLGYNDGYLLFGVIHSLFRLLGADPFLAAEFAIWGLRAIGFIAFWGLAHRALNLPFWAALAGATLFTLSSSAYLQSQHIQLLSISLAPLLAWWLINAWSQFYKGSIIQGYSYAFSAILLYALWLLSAFYMAWFFALFSLILIATTSSLAWPLVKNGLVHSITSPWRTRLLVITVAGAIAALPFLWIYLPKVRETGGHSFESALTFMLTPGDLLNIGEHNILWGWLFSQWKAALDLNPDNNHELLVGFPPIFLLGTLLIGGWLLLRHRHQHPLWASLALACFVSLILIVRVGDISLWWFIWQGVPGANGLRAVARYAIFLMLPLCLLWSFTLPHLARYYSVALCLPLVAWLWAEQLTLNINAEVPRSSYLQDTTNASAPPAQCNQFFVTNRRDSDRHIDTATLFGNLYPHNVAAMYFSEFWNLRTLNGFSTFNPPKWDFAYLPEDSYRYRVRDYVAHHEMVDGLCSFDLSALTWNTTPFSQSEINALITLSKQNEPPPTEELEIKLTHSEVHSVAGEQWRFSVAIENQGELPLHAQQAHAINLGLQLLDRQNNVVNIDLKRVPLISLLPGEKVEIPIDLPMASVDGHKVKVTLVQEGIRWLDNQAPPLFLTFPAE